MLVSVVSAEWDKGRFRGFGDPRLKLRVRLDCRLTLRGGLGLGEGAPGLTLPGPLAEMAAVLV